MSSVQSVNHLNRDEETQSVAIFLPTLSGGGAERAAINLARAFMEQNFDVTILLQEVKGELLSELPDGIYLHDLGHRHVLGCLLPLARYLHRRKPDILMSHLGHNNIIAIWARMLARSPAKVMVVQHNSLIMECAAHSSNWKYRVLPWLYRKFLPRADTIVAVSEGVADELAGALSVPRSRIQVIYNPIT